MAEKVATTKKHLMHIKKGYKIYEQNISKQS